MAIEVLSSDDTDGKILDKDWEGRYTVGLMVAGTETVKLRWRNPERSEDWLDASFNGTVIELGTEAGAALDITLCRDFDYQFYTAVAGAAVDIAKKDVYA